MLKTIIKTSGATGLILLANLANAKTVECKDIKGHPFSVKPKQITIHNNSENATIYPVVATSKNSTNEWIQGCFRTDKPHPTKFVYKLYINEGKGIPPGSSVTVTLPLYSQLSHDSYITWWNGGRVLLADQNERLRNEKDSPVTLASQLSCQGQDTDCNLTIYSSDTQFPENTYAQLSEYTFGDSIIPEGQSRRLLKPENVGYNISYVDHVYLPVAIGVKNNPYIGYSGSTLPLAAFRNHLDNFLKTTGEGWPVYNLSELKLPGGYNIFAQRFGTLPPEDRVPVKPIDGFPPVLTQLACIRGDCTEDQKKSLRIGESVQQIQNLWGSCITWDEDLSPFVTQKVHCPEHLKEKFAALKQFFQQNHQQYLKMHADGDCKLTPKVKPLPFSYWEVVKHLYGWVPFNEGCDAAANPLAATKIPGWDHGKIQSMYIHDLQYNYKDANLNPTHRFNPYTQLIHDQLAMDAYAFSVDDAVGFMSELGDGLVFTVGGTQGLENKQQFSYQGGFSVAIGVPKHLVKEVTTTLIKKYGVCALDQEADNLDCHQVKQDVIMPSNSQIAGFRVGTVASYPIKVRFTDLNDNVYTFEVNNQFAPCPSDINAQHCPTNRAELFNRSTCLVINSKGKKHPKSEDWCLNANPNQQREKQVTKNFLSFPQPVDFMK